MNIAKVVIIDNNHPWYGKAGRLVCFQKYGPGGMFSGWKLKLDEGNECFVKREQTREL